MDNENYDSETVNPGTWRNEPEAHGLQLLPSSLSNRSKKSSDLRERYADYFVGDGSIPWQARMIYILINEIHHSQV